MMIIIGLTGSIGSGKTTVARLMVDLGADHIDADKVGHEVYRPGSRGCELLVGTFGSGILDASGRIDRKKLGALVFADPALRTRLDAIVHPLIRREVERHVDLLRKKGKRVVVVEGAVLIEAGWKDMFDEVWAVFANETDMIERVARSRGVPEDDTRARIRAQMPPDKRRQHADVIIENNGDMEVLKAKVAREWDALASRHPKG